VPTPPVTAPTVPEDALGLAVGDGPELPDEPDVEVGPEPDDPDPEDPDPDPVEVAGRGVDWVSEDGSEVWWSPLSPP
jgi:hypothetical protein